MVWGTSEGEFKLWFIVASFVNPGGDPHGWLARSSTSNKNPNYSKSEMRRSDDRWKKTANIFSLGQGLSFGSGF